MTERDHLPIQAEDFERLFELVDPLRELYNLRTGLANSQPESADKFRRAISDLILLFPELDSGRDIVIFPDGHMETAKNIFETHSDLWERRLRFCEENSLPKPESTISGEIFEIGTTKYLRVDTLSFIVIKKCFDPTPFLENGYAVLAPDFYPIFP